MQDSLLTNELRKRQVNQFSFFVLKCFLESRFPKGRRRFNDVSHVGCPGFLRALRENVKCCFPMKSLLSSVKVPWKLTALCPPCVARSPCVSGGLWNVLNPLRNKRDILYM